MSFSKLPSISRSPVATDVRVFHAAATGDVGALAALLLDDQAQLNARDADGKTPLHHAIAARKLPCFEVALVTYLFSVSRRNSF